MSLVRFRVGLCLDAPVFHHPTSVSWCIVDWACFFPILSEMRGRSNLALTLTFSCHFHQLGDKFLLLLNPDFYPERPTKDWPLASFVSRLNPAPLSVSSSSPFASNPMPMQDQALFVALAYVVFVAVGPTIVKATIGPDAYVPPKDKNGQPKKVGIAQLCASICQLDTVIRHTDSHTLQLSVAEKFSNEPLLYGMVRLPRAWLRLACWHLSEAHVLLASGCLQYRTSWALWIYDVRCHFGVHDPRVCHHELAHRVCQPD